jgi:hypothetical protein
MWQNRPGGMALALSAITLILMSSNWVSEGEVRPAGLPAGGLAVAAQLTPGAATPAATTAAAASPTPQATATTEAAASPTLAATATSPAAVPTTSATIAAVATGTPTDIASPVATAAATSTASPAATVAATGTPTRAATPTPPPTATVPLATSTAVIVVTPRTALAPSTSVDTYMTGVTPQYQYYNGPNAQYPTEWYLQRHLGNPGQFTMYRTEPMGLCNTYYYQFQGVYYCYTGGAAAAMPDYVAPGMAVIPPSVLGPGALPPGMTVGVVPGMVGGVVQTGTGYAVQSAWANVAPQQQYYYGPNYQYDDDWYYARHLGNPSLYRVYSYDPVGQCASYYYRWQDRFYCYTGGSVGGTTAMLMPPPPGVAVDPSYYSLQSYWGQVDPSSWYYYGPTYQYDDAWYQQRHLANPLLYSTYPSDPGASCGSYAYQYQGLYYCYTGAYSYSSGDTDWSVPVRYWSTVDPTYRYYYGPDYGYDDAWYAQRHLANPALYQPYDFEPVGQCGSYYYRYQTQYYCYVGD